MLLLFSLSRRRRESTDEGKHNYFPDGIKGERRARGREGDEERERRDAPLQSASLPIHDDGGSAAGKHLTAMRPRRLIPRELFDTPS